jgi:hypothetical protein
MEYPLTRMVKDNFSNWHTASLKLTRWGKWALSVDKTPGIWNMSTLLGECEWSPEPAGDVIYLDCGRKWYVKGFTVLLEEAQRVMRDNNLQDKR